MYSNIHGRNYDRGAKLQKLWGSKSFAEVVKEKGQPNPGPQKPRREIVKNPPVRVKEVGNEWLHRSANAKMTAMRSIALYFKIK